MKKQVKEHTRRWTEEKEEEIRGGLREGASAAPNFEQCTPAIQIRPCNQRELKSN